MKNGIIIIFGKNDIDITETHTFKPFFDKKITVCLVNNGNHKEVDLLLLKLKEVATTDIFILNLRKERVVQVAVKAGVRFLSSKGNMKLIIHSKPKNICNPELVESMLAFLNQDLSIKKEERVLLRSVYCVNEISKYKLELL